MPQFRFRALTGNVVRTGRLTATDKNDALEKIRAAGLAPVEVSEDSEQRSLDLGERLGNAAPILSKSYSAISSRFSGYKVGAALIGLGALVFVYSRYSGGVISVAPTKARQPAEMAQAPINFKLQLKLNGPSPALPPDLEIVARLPDVPYEVRKSWADLAASPAGEASLHFNLLSLKPANSLEVTATSRSAGLQGHGVGVAPREGQSCEMSVTLMPKIGE